MTYPNAVAPGPRPAYVPRIFGFRIHKPGSMQLVDLDAKDVKAGAGAGAGERDRVGDRKGGTPTAGAAAAAAEARRAGAAAADDGAGRAVAGAGASAGSGRVSGAAARRDLTTVLPADKSGKIVGRDGRLLSPEDDFFSEGDAPGHGMAPVGSAAHASAGAGAGAKPGGHVEKLDSGEGGSTPGASPGARDAVNSAAAGLSRMSLGRG